MNKQLLRTWEPLAIGKIRPMWGTPTPARKNAPLLWAGLSVHPAWRLCQSFFEQWVVPPLDPGDIRLAACRWAPACVKWHVERLEARVEHRLVSFPGHAHTRTHCHAQITDMSIMHYATQELMKWDSISFGTFFCESSFLYRIDALCEVFFPQYQFLSSKQKF